MNTVSWFIVCMCMAITNTIWAVLIIALNRNWKRRYDEMNKNWRARCKKLNDKLNKEKTE